MSDSARQDDPDSKPAAGVPVARDEDNVTELPRNGEAVAQRPPRRFRGLSRPLLRLLLMVGLPLAVCYQGLAWWIEAGRFVVTENAYVKNDMAAISTDVDGRVIEVHVRENQTVDPGQVLFVLDPRPFEIAKQQLFAQLDTVRHEIESMRAEFSAGVAGVRELRERVQYLEGEVERNEQLARRGVVTATKLSEQRFELQSARQAMATAAQKNRMIVAELGGDPRIDASAHPKYQEVLAKIDAIELDLERATVRAPNAGVVANIALQPGEYIEKGQPVFALIAANAPWIQANLKETQLTHVSEGQPVRITADAYPDAEFRGRIHSIAPATGAEFALLPAQNASGNWVKVVQRVPVRVEIAEAPGLPNLRAGMSIRAEIDTGRDRSIGRVVAEMIYRNELDAWLPDPLLAMLSPG